MSTTKEESRLLALMEESLNAGLELQHFSEENICVFSGEDEKAIEDVLERRQNFLDILANLEKEINLITGSMADGLPEEGRIPQFYENRRTLRRVLDAVTAMDKEAMKLLEAQIHDYRDRTVNARNKKHISAYIESGAPNLPDNKFDYLK